MAPEVALHTSYHLTFSDRNMIPDFEKHIRIMLITLLNVSGGKWTPQLETSNRVKSLLMAFKCCYVMSAPHTRAPRRGNVQREMKGWILLQTVEHEHTHRVLDNEITAASQPPFSAPQSVMQHQRPCKAAQRAASRVSSAWNRDSVNVANLRVQA